MAPSFLLLLPVVPLLMIAAALPANSTSSASAAAGETKRWALLVAGSNDYKNYRHQADVCHAFQLLKGRGIPEENIVVMMYDDIAQHELNPSKGFIYHSTHGPDVYKGVPKDYTGPNVTPETFLRVLQGQDPVGGSKKVIDSGPNDHIFVFFSGHGGPGLLAFPKGEKSFLSAPKFTSVIKEMHKKKRYAKMVIYVEACYAGSMFTLLPENLTVYVTTAANASQKSYSVCRDPIRNTPLGNAYSINWIEHSENRASIATTLDDQYKEVKRKTTMSDVTQYGDARMGSLKIGEFQGMKLKRPRPADLTNKPCEPISNPDVPIDTLKNNIEETEDPAEKKSLQKKLERTLENRAFLQGKIAEIATLIAREKKADVESLMTSEKDLKNFGCYEAAVAHFDASCFSLSANPYSLEHLQVFVNACESGYPLRDITAAMNSACTEKDIRGII